MMTEHEKGRPETERPKRYSMSRSIEFSRLPAE